MRCGAAVFPKAMARYDAVVVQAGRVSVRLMRISVTRLYTSARRMYPAGRFVRLVPQRDGLQPPGAAARAEKASAKTVYDDFIRNRAMISPNGPAGRTCTGFQGDNPVFSVLLPPDGDVLRPDISDYRKKRYAYPVTWKPEKFRSECRDGMVVLTLWRGLLLLHLYSRVFSGPPS